MPWSIEAAVKAKGVLPSISMVFLILFLSGIVGRVNKKPTSNGSRWKNTEMSFLFFSFLGI